MLIAVAGELGDRPASVLDARPKDQALVDGAGQRVLVRRVAVSKLAYRGEPGFEHLGCRDDAQVRAVALVARQVPSNRVHLVLAEMDMDVDQAPHHGEAAGVGATDAWPVWSLDLGSTPNRLDPLSAHPECDVVDRCAASTVDESATGDNRHPAVVHQRDNLLGEAACEVDDAH